MPSGSWGAGARLVGCSTPKSKALGPLLLQAPARPWLAREARLSHLATWLPGQVTLPLAALGTQARAGVGLERVWVWGDATVPALCSPLPVAQGLWGSSPHDISNLPKKECSWGRLPEQGHLGDRDRKEEGAQRRSPAGRGTWEVPTPPMGWVRASWVLPGLSPWPTSLSWLQFPPVPGQSPAPGAVPSALPVRLGASLSTGTWGLQAAGERELGALRALCSQAGETHGSSTCRGWELRRSPTCSSGTLGGLRLMSGWSFRCSGPGERQ